MTTPTSRFQLWNACLGNLFEHYETALFGFLSPFHAWAAQLVPHDARYPVISLGYALGYQIFDSPTAALALWCFKKTGIVSSVPWYWMFLRLLSSAIIAFELHSKKVQVLEEI